MSTNEQNEDSVNDVAGTYIPAEKKTELEKNRRELLNKVVGGSAFLSSIRHRNIRKAYNAFEEIIRAETGVIQADADYQTAVTEHQRTVELLRDAHTIHQTDKDIRDAEATRAKAHLAKQKHEAYIAGLEMDVERKNAEDQHRRLMNSEDVEDAILSEEDEELMERFESARVPHRAKYLAELFKNNNDLTPEEEKMVDNVAEQWEKANS